jgi:uncharacterized repeat protein (TIGR01451 family)
MFHLPTLKRLAKLALTLVLLTGMHMSCTAQLVLVPDTNIRSWLNDVAPGSVDANGYLDTQSPALELAYSYYTLSIDWAPSDLTGIEYLHGASVITIEYLIGGPTVVPSWPTDLNTLSVVGFPEASMPALPDSLEGLRVRAAAQLLALPPLPNTLRNLDLNNCNSLATLPSIGTELTYLHIDSCAVLTSLPQLPASLFELSVNTCALFGPTLSLPAELPGLYLTDLPSLVSIPSGSVSAAITLTDLPMLSNLPLFCSSCALNFLSIDNCPMVPVPASIPDAAYLWIKHMPWTTLPVLGDVGVLLIADVPITTFQVSPPSLYRLDLLNVPITGTLSLSPNLQHVLLDSTDLSVIDAWPNAPTDISILNCPLLLSLPADPLVGGSLTIEHCPQLLEIPAIHEPFRVIVKDLPNVDSLNVHFSGNANGFLEVTDLPALVHVASLPVNVSEEFEQTAGFFNCPALSCLPELRELCYPIVINTGVTCFPNYPTWVIGVGIPPSWPPLCNVTNSTCAVVKPVIAGGVFLDVDGDGVQGGGEPPVPNVVVEAATGGYLGISNSTGWYELAADTFSYVVAPHPPLYHVLSTPAQNVSFASYLEIDTLAAFGIQAFPNVVDLVAHSTPTAPPVPGFDRAVTLTASHLGTLATDAVVSYTFDPALTWIASLPPPDVQNGNTAQWNITGLAPGATWSAAVQHQTPVATLLGDTLASSLTIVPALADTTPANNVVSMDEVVVGSFDPNDKTVTPAVALPQAVLNGLDLDYLIRFQNTGTYPAARVVITDTLSSDLDASSFHFIASSHPCTWSMERAVLYFIFDPIYLPDSALNEPGSHGFVRFSIKPIPSLADGAQVSNTANIYFDFNEPVITEPSIFQVDMGASVSEHGAPGAHIWPNPATDVLVIDLPSAMGTKGRCVVYDAMGRQMLQVPATGQRTIVSLAPLAPGAYRIHLIGGGHSSSHGFVKE